MPVHSRMASIAVDSTTAAAAAVNTTVVITISIAVSMAAGPGCVYVIVNIVHCGFPRCKSMYCNCFFHDDRVRSPTYMR